LPAQAALHVCLLQPISPFVLEQLKQQMGVTELVLADANNALEIALQTQESALPVLNFLRQVAVEITHFSTAKSKLEDVFLNLTGRSLRD
jgi:ABC-2 type transport system ATP-binding protein